MRHFFLFLFAFAGFTLSAQQPAGQHRHYQPSNSFLSNSDERCFEATKKEADRAFAQRCWDDAGLLYRAAKNCIDADQQRRQEMTDRLEACRAAAEMELINRERQAIAANRADDAHELLRQADRSLAYRMADFANRYIAPPDEDNPDCQQAIFDAWYTSSDVTGLGDRYNPVQVPFCYQLGENLGDNLIVRFAGTGTSEKIYAFSPNRHLLYSWDAQTLEQAPSVTIDPAMIGFDIAPDGITFLFHSGNQLLFWRKGQELYRLNVPRIHYFCFDKNGDEFFLLDTIEKKIDVLSLRGVYLGVNNYKVQKQRKVEEVLIPPTFRPWVTDIQPGVLDFEVSNNEVWLGYADSLMVLRKSGSGKPWYVARSQRWDKPITAGIVVSTPFLRLFPEQNLAFYGNDTSSTLVRLPVDSVPAAAVHLSGYPLAIPSSSGHIATLSLESYLYPGNIQVYEEPGNLAYVSAIPETEYYPFMSGVLDPEGKWLIIPSANGLLHCWRLENSSQNIMHRFAPGIEFGANISPDGHCYVSHKGNEVRVKDCLQPGVTLGEPIYLPSETYVGSPHMMSNHWVASPFPGDSMLVWNWQTGKKWYFQIFSNTGIQVVAFSSDERFLAAAHADGQIRVYALTDGQVVATRPYSGQIRELMFIPGKNELIVLQVNTSDYDYSEKTVLRIINPFQKDSRQRIMRLHDYHINLLAVSDQGDYLAVSDGQDIRVFDPGNLTDELSQILPTGQGMARNTPAEVMAIQFHPDGRSLISSYSDQSVVFWNIFSGQPNFKLQSPTEATFMVFTKIRIIPEQNMLCLLSPSDALLLRSLDYLTIRSLIQPLHHQLIAFTPDQIRKYNLDQALNYPGNFERLAGSEDTPLINAFFSYYFQQARTSSNIERVSEYCDRAFVLYAQLDTATQSELRLTMLEMYDNYHWKWLIRGRPDKADQVLQHLNRQFNYPFIGKLAEANTALLRGNPADLRRAVRLYADWVIQMSDGANMDMIFDPALQPVFDKLVQLAEFELIGDKQIDCLCGVFGDWRNFTLCNNRSKDPALAPFDPVMRIRWDIYKKRYLATQTDRYAEQLEILRSAQADVRQLPAQQGTTALLQMEKVALQMGTVYLNWARFEQGNRRSLELCSEGIELLQANAPYHQEEQRRLETIAYLYHEWSNNLYNMDQFDASYESCQEGYNVSYQLWSMTSDTFDLHRYADELVGNQLTLLGNLQVMRGEWEAARTTYDNANNVLTLGLNSYYTAHIDLLEGKEIEALLNYGSIFTSEQLGNVVFDLERLADRFPDRKDSMLLFIPRLRTAWLANHPRSDSIETEYRYARLHTQRAAILEHYDQALQWNAKALQYVDAMLQKKNTAYNWPGFWVDAMLNQSYYLVFNSKNDTAQLTRAIKVAKEAEEKAMSETDYSFYSPSVEYLQTNMAHAYLLRNRPGDQEEAINAYKKFLDLDSARTGSYWDTLMKDFRDLHDAGLQWPDLKSVIAQIKPPYVKISADEWQEIGVDMR